MKDCIFQIHKAEPSDVDAIFSVRTAVLENHMSEEALAEIGVTRASTRNAIIENTLPIWCAWENNQLVGFASIKEDDAELFALFVLPEYESHGIGGALHTVAVQWWFERHPHEALNLNTEKQARAFAFYEKRGWVLVPGEAKSHMLEGDVFMRLLPRV